MVDFQETTDEIICNLASGQVLADGSKIGLANEKFRELIKVAKKSAKTIVLDLSKVEFFNSASLEHLIAMTKSCQQEGVECKFTSLDSNLENMLQLLNLDRFVN